MENLPEKEQSSAPKFAYSNRPASKPPSRIGQPPSITRNFYGSSAGGAPGNSCENEAEKAMKARAWGQTYVPKEDSLRNDYSMHYVLTGSRPQNHIRSVQLKERFSEYPKLKSLLSAKHGLLQNPSLSIPPTIHTVNPLELNFSMDTKFDVVLLSPPPEITYDQLRALDLGRWTSNPSFIWLWVGSGGADGIGLENGRELIANWGFRRCEDIVWLKTNSGNVDTDLDERMRIADSGEPTRTLFTPTIEHCLMGIRGTVRRSTDGHFVHCNVDTDVIVWEGDPDDSTLKPPEIQTLIENFCQGTRRLHLFGKQKELRRGWVTVDESLKTLVSSSASIEDSLSHLLLSDVEKVYIRDIEGEEQPLGGWKPCIWSQELWESWGLSASCLTSKFPKLLPFDNSIESLRPKSPPPVKFGAPSSGGLGRGRGAGLGVTRSNHPNITNNSYNGHSQSPDFHNKRGHGRGRGYNNRGHSNHAYPGNEFTGMPVQMQMPMPVSIPIFHQTPEIYGFPYGQYYPHPGYTVYPGVIQPQFGYQDQNGSFIPVDGPYTYGIPVSPPMYAMSPMLSPYQNGAEWTNSTPQSPYFNQQ